MPPDELRSAVQSLRNLTPRLNTITDLAGQTVRDVEHFLNEECSVGVPARVQFDASDEGEHESCLEYRRIGPRYRIAVVNYFQGEEEGVRPWADSHRRAKLDSFAKLPSLLAQIAANVEERILQAEEAAKTIATTLAAFRKSPPPSRKAKPSNLGLR